MASKSKVGCSISTLDTPAFLVDLEKTKRNCENMTDMCKKLGVTLRPQTKTHKTLEGAILQTNGTKRCIVVSTLPEAELYADNGFDDILYGYPVTPNKIERCMILANKIQEFHLMIDNDTILEYLQRSPIGENKKWSVFVAIDCGNGREGVYWADTLGIHLIQKIVTSENVHFSGIYVHCGNSYVHPDFGTVEQVEKDTVSRIQDFVDRLDSIGIKCPVFGTGSTPTCSQPIKELGSLTELHPGNYLFYDAQQMALKSCLEDQISVKVATRVIGHSERHNHLLIDCGWEGLSLDGYDLFLPSGFVVVEGEPNLRLIKMTQEIGKVTPIEGKLDFSKYPIGSMLFLYPYHSCATAAMHSIYYVTDSTNVVDTWIPVKGW